jgi:hypothetical protein
LTSAVASPQNRQCSRQSVWLPSGCKSWLPVFGGGDSSGPRIGRAMHPVPDQFMLRAHLRSNLPPPRLAVKLPKGRVMSKFFKMKHSRDQWKKKAAAQQGECYQRTGAARIKAERDQVAGPEARPACASWRRGGTDSPLTQGDVVHLALNSF